jgi:hypothetical protein
MWQQPLRFNPALASQGKDVGMSRCAHTQIMLHNQFDGVNKTCIFTPLIFNYE